MNAQQLFEWLSALTEEQRRAAECRLEMLTDTVPLVTAKHQPPYVFLIYK